MVVNVCPASILLKKLFIPWFKMHFKSFPAKKMSRATNAFSETWRARLGLEVDFEVKIFADESELFD